MPAKAVDLCADYECYKKKAKIGHKELSAVVKKEAEEFEKRRDRAAGMRQATIFELAKKTRIDQ